MAYFSFCWPLCKNDFICKRCFTEYYPLLRCLKCLHADFISMGALSCLCSLVVALSLAFAKNYKLYSIISSVFIASFFVSLNAITTPEIAWAIYPIFVVLWWPVALYFSQKPFLFSMIAFSMLSIFFVCVNYITSPATIWAVYPIFIAIWWPLSLYFFSYKRQSVS